MIDDVLNDLKISTTSAFLKRGMGCYNKGCVKNIYISNHDDKTGTSDFVGKVKSESSNKIYDIEFTTNDTEFTDYYCSCPAFDDYGVPCKHIVAAFYSYYFEKNCPSVFKNRTGTSLFVNNNGDAFLSDFIKFNENINFLPETQIKLQVRITIDKYYSSTSFVDFRIGDKKLYIIKNMDLFFNSIKENTYLQLGKLFTFIPSQQHFCEEDKNILALLSDIYSQNQAVLDVSRRFIYSDSKKLYLSFRTLKNLFKILKDKNFILNFSGNEFEANIIEGNPPVSFSLDLVKNKMVLKSKGALPYPLTPDCEYLLLGDKIYHTDKDFNDNYNIMFNHLSRSKNNTITFSENDGDKVATYVIPKLKKISKELNIKKSIQDKIIEYPLISEIYFDKNSSDIFCTIYFNYGDIKINPYLDTNNNGKFLLRDKDGEDFILKILEFYSFKSKNDIAYLDLRDEENVFNFLSQGLLKLQEKSEVFYSEAFKNIRLYNSSSIHSKISLRQDNLLEFSFDFEDINKSEIKNIFEGIKEKKKYFKLKSGSFLNLEDNSMKDFAKLIDYLDIKDKDFDKDKILLSANQAMYIDELSKDKNLGFIKKDSEFKGLIKNIRSVDDNNFDPPESLEKILRDYQVFGYKWFKTLSECRLGGILADEMGLGKTLQAISYIASLDTSLPSLVIAPTSLIYNWQSEIEKFCPSLSSVVIDGNKKEREELMKNIEITNIVITSYPLIRRDIDFYSLTEFECLIIDEAQNIKNPSSINAESVKQLKSRSKFALTGTPLENSLTELWSIFDFVMPGYLLNQSKFSKKYETPIVKNNDKDALIELNRHIKPFILRRLKSDVLKELPAKIEHYVPVEMTKKQKEIYVAYLESSKKEAMDELSKDERSRSRIKILALLTRLRQICCDPSVFIENYDDESGKINALLDIVSSSTEEGHRILLFSQFTSVLKHIGQKLTNLKIQYFYLDGTTDALERNEMVKKFNAGENNVFLISLKAGGTGLNLTGADMVIHFDPWWNPAVEDQATDRAHRIGQTKTVEVMKLIARGTIEEKIIKLQDKKRALIKDVLTKDQSDVTMFKSMTDDEIASLFNR